MFLQGMAQAVLTLEPRCPSPYCFCFRYHFHFRFHFPSRYTGGNRFQQDTSEAHLCHRGSNILHYTGPLMHQ